MDLKYREVTCCPMCGRKGRLIMQISSGIKDTVTQGNFTGSGVGLGLGMGGIGLGVGYNCNPLHQPDFNRQLTNLKLKIQEMSVLH